MINPDIRALAIAADSTASASFDLGLLWRKLCDGTWRVRGTFSEGSRLFALVEDVPKPRKASPAAVAAASRVVIGESSKVVAIERGVTESTVSVCVKMLLRRMGLSCRIRALPLIVVLAARARASERPSAGARVAELAQLHVIGVETPIVAPAHLTMAEREVLLQVLEGRRYREIAAERQRSLRTIANQALGAFKKLGVSTQREARALLIAGVAA